MRACKDAFGQPNVLINNAGIGSTGKPVHEETVEKMRANFDVNVIGQFLGMKTVIPGMIEMGGGSIVNVSSVWGWAGIKNNVAYQTAKGAAVMLSKNAAVTYAPTTSASTASSPAMSTRRCRAPSRRRRRRC